MSTRSSLVSFFSGTEMPAVIIVPPTLPTNSLCLVNSSISTLLAIYYKGEDKLCLNYYPSLPSNNKDLGHGSSYVKTLPSRRTDLHIQNFEGNLQHIIRLFLMKRLTTISQTICISIYALV